MIFPWLVACGSGSTNTVKTSAFAVEDCPKRAFVEVARVPIGQSADMVSGYWLRGLAVSNDRLFVMRQLLFTQADRTWEKTIVGTIPTSGGDLVDVASTPDDPNPNDAPALITVDGDTLVVASGGQAASVQLGQDIAPLPALPPNGVPEQSVADDDSVYTTLVKWNDRNLENDGAQPVQVLRTPRAGGDGTVLYSEQLVGATVGGMADVGDAVLVSLGWSEAHEHGNEYFGKIMRVPKDGGPATRVRSDVPFDNRATWLGWDGTNIEASVYDDVMNDRTYRARVPLDGGPAVRTRLPPVGGLAVPTAHGSLVVNNPADDSNRLALMSQGKSGDGAVLACGPQISTDFVGALGIARGSQATYVAYEPHGGSDLVIYRVDD